MGIITGVLTWDEEHEPSAEARAYVTLVEGSEGPNQGTVIATLVIEDPGDKPVEFELQYDLDDTESDRTYSLWGGLVDGDLAWVSADGRPIDAPEPFTDDVRLRLSFRPDLLKAAVSGTINGIALNTSSPDAYATVVIDRVDTAETVGYQIVSPAGLTPIAYSVPFDRDDIDENAIYVVRAAVWDGETRWETQVNTPVITDGNPLGGVDLAVTEVATPEPTPTPSPTPAPSAAPVAPADSGDPSTVLWLVLIALIVLGIGAVAMYLRTRQASRTRPPAGPGTGGGGA